MNAEELFSLGEKYYCGDNNGTPANKEKALNYFIQSAEAGYKPAELMVGYMYDFADGIDSDPERAVFWYKKASDAGDGNATLNLANMYIEGRGVTKNLPKGNRLYKKAIQQHNAVAASNLGNNYLLGNGVPVSLQEGAKYIRMAEEWGYINSEDMNNLGCSYKEAENYAEAFKCFTKAIKADNTNQSAIWNYGFSLYNGQGTDVDYRAAKPYLTSFLKNNPNDEQARLIVNGIKLYKNLENTLDLLLKFARTHNAAIVDISLTIRVKSEEEVSIIVSFSRWDNHRNDDKHKAYYLSEYWNEFENMFSLYNTENGPAGEKCFYIKKAPIIALTKQDVFSVIVNLFKKLPDVSVDINANRYEIVYSEL